MRRILREAVRIQKAGDGAVVKINTNEDNGVTSKVKLLNDKRERFMEMLTNNGYILKFTFSFGKQDKLSFRCSECLKYL